MLVSRGKGPLVYFRRNARDTTLPKIPLLGTFQNKPSFRRAAWPTLPGSVNVNEPRATTYNMSNFTHALGILTVAQRNEQDATASQPAALPNWLANPQEAAASHRLTVAGSLDVSLKDSRYCLARLG